MLPHGTEAGAAAHRRRKEKPCSQCKAAERAAERERRRRRTGASPPAPTPVWEELKEQAVASALRMLDDLYRRKK